MWIRHLTLLNCPNEKDYEAEFDPDIVFLSGREAESIMQAIDVLTSGDRTSDIPAEALITAEVETEDGVFFVTAEQGGMCAYLGLSDATEQYLKMIKGRDMEIGCRFYPSFKTSFSNRLKEYRLGSDESEVREVGSKAFFQGFVSTFIRQFQPIRLRCSKELYLQLDADGNFYVASKENRIPIKALSQSEQTMLEYYCFLLIQKFWGEYKQMQDIHTEFPPLLISGLFSKLDESYSLDSVVQETKELGHQCFFVK